ncbi:MAG: EI24 domain-containing protein [Bacteroidetes bacterium]|nr:EI24 domain-containing protein [Bacteroidota bacterium]
MKSRNRFFEQFALASKSYIKALSFVIDNGLWIYFIYPLIISILMIVGGFSFATSLSNSLEHWILHLPIAAGLNDAAWTGFLHFFLRIGLYIIFFFIYLTLNKYIVLILMSPAMASLSERTEQIISATKHPFNLLQFVKDISRGICIALRNMFIEFGVIILCFMVVWIPIIGWLSPLFLFILSCYFYGFSMVDYTNERRKMNISESVKYMRKNKGLVIGNGCIFSLLFAIPFIGGPISAILAPVAATIAVLETK